jgi:hypothetical protein
MINNSNIISHPNNTTDQQLHTIHHITNNRVYAINIFKYKKSYNTNTSVIYDTDNFDYKIHSLL